MTSIEKFNVAKDIITGIVAITGVVIAYLGLQTWRKQIKGTYEYDLAKRVILNANQLQDAINGVRNPWVSGEAVAEYESRWKKVVESATKFKLAIHEAGIVWNKSKVRKLLKKYEQHTGKLYIALESYLTDKENPSTDSADRAFTKDDAYVLYSGRERPSDNYDIELNNIVKEIEEYVSPYLKIN